MGGVSGKARAEREAAAAHPRAERGKTSKARTVNAAELRPQIRLDEDKDFSPQPFKRAWEDARWANSMQAKHAPQSNGTQEPELYTHVRPQDFSIAQTARHAETSTSNTNASALTNKQTLNEAASAPRDVGQSSENQWPALPVEPQSELTDEILAVEREMKRVRRLEREQRGISWNA